MTDETERVAVKTYVPRYQKEEWEKHAKSLDMTQSEFIRTMVQAGRSGIVLEDYEKTSNDTNSDDTDLETRLLELLDSENYLSWDQLVEELAGNFEDRLEDTLQRLQNENRVQYSGRRGGYTVVSDGE